MRTRKNAGILRTEKDNCARNSESAVPLWARLETPEWRKYGVCNASTPVITRAELEAREKAAKERKTAYDKWCGDGNKADCAATETCFFDREHITGSGSVWYGQLPANRSVCLCQWPRARANPDGTGACVTCKPGADGRPSYVTRPVSGNGTAPVKTFEYGEFA